MNLAAANSSVSNPVEISALKRRVALHSMLAAACMTALKLAAGILSGSLGVLSDAAHSALDLAGAALTFFSVRVSDKPPDEDHTYGHGKIENLSAFFEAGLMATGIAFPTVPEGKARIRTIMTATHTQDELQQALEVLKQVGKRMGILT